LHNLLFCALANEGENMPHDLQMLVWSAALALIQMIIAVLAAIAVVGLPTLAGNREGLPTLGGLAGRARRAHLNMLENLAIFAIFVIVAQVTGRSNATTALGTTLFFWARVAHALVYLAGIPWVRTAVWTVSLVGIVMVGAQLL
jgi:uncharacterized MAPEG superfamily protein